MILFTYTWRSSPGLLEPDNDKRQYVANGLLEERLDATIAAVSQRLFHRQQERLFDRLHKSKNEMPRSVEASRPSSTSSVRSQHDAGRPLLLSGTGGAPAAIDRYLPSAPWLRLSSCTSLLLSTDGTDRRTDTCPLHRLCSAYYRAASKITRISVTLCYMDHGLRGSASLC